MNSENQKEMDDYEQKEFDAIVAWKKEEPSVMSKALGFVFKPASWLVSKVVPPKAIEGCLIALDKIAEFLTDTQDIIRDGAVTKIEELQRKDLRLSDNLANSVHNWALTTAATEGGVAGSAGLPGLAVDIPALITMSLRLIHKIGVCYGFEINSEADRNFVLGVLSAASANSVQEKVTSVALLQKINVIVAQTTWKKIMADAAKNKTGLPAFIVAIKTLAKQLGINLTKRKAAQIIPIVGGGVGAAMNMAFINDVAWAARRMYQERWLMVNKKTA